MVGIQYEILVEYAREEGVDPEVEGRVVEVDAEAEREELGSATET